MSPTAAFLAGIYPQLYHMGHANSWPSIEKHGLLSTKALLDLFEIVPAQREKLEACRRPESITIEHPAYGRAILRDQKPLNEKKLAKSLQGDLSPRDWLLLLNSRVFFWGPVHRLGDLQGAQAYRAKRQTIIVVDTKKLLERYEQRVLLSHMNTGSTQRMAFPRGDDTFLPLNKYPLVERRRKYGMKGAVAEITIDYAIPDVRELATLVYEVGGEAPQETLWSI